MWDQKTTWLDVWTFFANSTAREVVLKMEHLSQVKGALGSQVLTPQDCSVQENVAKNLTLMASPETTEESRAQLASKILLKYANGIEPYEQWLLQINTNPAPFFTV